MPFLSNPYCLRLRIFSLLCYRFKEVSGILTIIIFPRKTIKQLL